MSFISYAQNFEDVMLWRALHHIPKGFYIDVGANDPITDSVTKAFYDSGWTGINIEPVEQHYRDLQTDRANDLNLLIAAGNFNGEATIIIPTTRGWASLNETMIEKYQQQDKAAIQIVTPIRTLDRIWQEHHGEGEVHFLKIDVENYEKQVLEGITLSVYRPWIIVVESTLPNSQFENSQEWEYLLLNNNYEMVYFDGLNRFFCAHEHADLKKYFNTPPNVFDDFIRFQEYHAKEKLKKIEEILSI